MRQTGGGRTGYHPFLLDICCVKDLVAAFHGLVFQKCGEVTNSSTLLPSTFAKYTGRPEKYLSLHFANSIWKNNMTEVMAQGQTDGTAGALALAGTGLMDCSVGGAGAPAAPTASNELTDGKRSSTSRSSRPTTSRSRRPSRSGRCRVRRQRLRRNRPVRQSRSLWYRHSELLRAFCNIPRRHHFTSNSTRSSSGTLRSMSLRATWRSCAPSASLVVTWATISRSTMPSSSPSVVEVSTATV